MNINRLLPNTASAAVGLGLAVPASALSTTASFSSIGSTEGVGSFTGSLSYGYDPGLGSGELIVNLTNTTESPGELVGFGFNIFSPHDEEEPTLTSMGYDPKIPGEDNPSQWELIRDVKVSPYGSFEWGVTVVGKKHKFSGNHGGSTGPGLDSGQSGVFTFAVQGGDAAGLDAESFLAEKASAKHGKQDAPFIARYQSVGDHAEDSDKVIGDQDRDMSVIPSPAAVGAGLVMFGALGLVRRRRG